MNKDEEFAYVVALKKDYTKQARKTARAEMKFKTEEKLKREKEQKWEQALEEFKIKWEEDIIE